MTINNRIAEVKTIFGLNNNQLAKRLGVHPTVVYNIIDEKGRKSKPSYNLIFKLMLSFDNINGDWLLTGRGNMLIEKNIPDIEVPSSAPCNKAALEMICDLAAENALLKKEVEELKKKLPLI